MAQQYYNTAKTAEILGRTTEEVKQMLDRHELHGYRDGADWKFKVEDIDEIAKTLPPKAEGASPAAQTSEDEGGDVLLSEVELGQADPGLSGTVIGLGNSEKPAAASDFKLAESDIALGALSDSAASKTPPTLKPISSGSQENKPEEKFEDLELALDDSSAKIETSPTMIGGLDGSSAIDLSGHGQGDDIVLGGSSAGSDVSLGDSGISLVDPADSGFSLETPVNLDAAAGEALVLGEDDLLAPGGSNASGATLLKKDDDFQLTPLEDVGGGDESESGSQVIALDSDGDESATMIGAAQSGASMAAMLDEDLSAQPALNLGGVSGLSDSSVGLAAGLGAAAAMSAPGMGIASPLTPAPALGAKPGAGMTEGAPIASAAAVAYEAPYTVWQIVALSACFVFMILCGIMIFDLIRNMWGWDQPYSVNSKLMDSLLKLFEK